MEKNESANTPPPNDVDEVLQNQQLINILVDTQSVKEVLTEFSVRLETAQQQIVVLQDKKDIAKLNDRLDRITDQIETVSSQIPSQHNKIAAWTTNEIDKQIQELKNDFEKKFSESSTLSKNESVISFQDQLDSFKKANIDTLPLLFPTISQYNDLVSRCAAMESDIITTQSMIQHSSPGSSTENGQAFVSMPPKLNEFILQLNRLQEKVDSLSEKGSSPEQNTTEFLKQMMDTQKKLDDHEKKLKDIDNTVFLFGQKFHEYRNETDGRINDMNIPSTLMTSLTKEQPNQISEIDSSILLQKILPMITELQNKQQILEEKVKSQDEIIQSYRKKTPITPQRQTVSFSNQETESHHISTDELIDTYREDTDTAENTARLLSSRKSPDLPMQTPRNHQSFKDLSHHINDTELRVTDLENEVLILKAIVTDLNSKNNEGNESTIDPETISAIKQFMEQRHNSSSKPITPQPIEAKIEPTKAQTDNKIETRSMIEPSSESPRSVQIINVEKPDLTKEHPFDDFTIDDICNMSRNVESLLVRVSQLEARSPLQFITPADGSEQQSQDPSKHPSTSNTEPHSEATSLPVSPNKSDRHVVFSTASVQTFEDQEIQVVITNDATTSPAPTPGYKEVDINQHHTGNSAVNFRSILPIDNSTENIDANEPDINLSSARPDSEPNQDPKKPKMELRISTPINEEGTKTPSDSTPTSATKTGRLTALNEKYTALIDELNSTIDHLKDSISILQGKITQMDNCQLGLSKSINDISTELESNKVKRDQDEEFITKLLNQVRFEVDQRLMGLTPQMVEDMNNVASLAVVKKMSMNFQFQIDELERHINRIREFLNNLITKNDLDAMLDQININNNANGETAAATSPMRCLLCGKVSSGVTGMITESEMARMLGGQSNLLGTKRTRNSLDNNKLVLTYGKDPLKLPNKKRLKVATLPPMEDATGTNNATA